jgi:hypothetical protein
VPLIIVAKKRSVSINDLVFLAFNFFSTRCNGRAVFLVIPQDEIGWNLFGSTVILKEHRIMIQLQGEEKHKKYYEMVNRMYEP